MSLLSGIELLSVLVVVGILLLLTIRLRTRTSNVILLLVIAILLLALISLSKLMMALFGAVVVLGIVLVLYAVFSFRRS